MAGFLLYSLISSILNWQRFQASSTSTIQSSKVPKHTQTHRMIGVDKNLVTLGFFFSAKLPISRRRKVRAQEVTRPPSLQFFQASLLFYYSTLPLDKSHPKIILRRDTMQVWSVSLEQCYVHFSVYMSYWQRANKRSTEWDILLSWVLQIFVNFTSPWLVSNLKSGIPYAALCSHKPYTTPVNRTGGIRGGWSKLEWSPWNQLGDFI